MGVPVIAYAATAVPATMDGAGILYTDKDPIKVAATINTVVTDQALRARIVDGQYEALDRLEARDFDGAVVKFVDQILAMPRREHPPVAFDFWDQMANREWLKEVRSTRPSAFMALPWEKP